MSGIVFDDNDDDEEDVVASTDGDRDVFVNGVVDMFDGEGSVVSAGGDVDVGGAGMTAPMKEMTEQQCVLIIHKDISSAFQF